MTTHNFKNTNAARRLLGPFLGLAAAVLVTAALFGRPPSAQAFGSYLSAFEAQYPAAKGSRIDSCLLCHTTSSGGPRNNYGAAYASNGYSFTALESLDSDGDGFSNLAEIQALTFPGDPADHPAPAPTNTPTSLPTATAVPPTATPVPPTATSVPPTATNTPAGPTPTATNTSVPPTPGGPGLAVRAFLVSPRVTIGGEERGTVWIWLSIMRNGAVSPTGTAEVVGSQNGVKVYDVTIPISTVDRSRGRYFLPRYVPTVAGKIFWTVTLDDGNIASAVTEVISAKPEGEHHDPQATSRPEDDHGVQPTAQPQPSGSGSGPAPTTVVQPPSGDDGSHAATAISGACTGTHVVQAGENLFRIGFNCGFSLAQMAAVNGIGWPYQVHVGQVLRFP